MADVSSQEEYSDTESEYEPISESNSDDENIEKQNNELIYKLNEERKKNNIVKLIDIPNNIIIEQ